MLSCRPSTFRTEIKVSNLGFPCPRSMATKVLIPIPANSESSNWFTFKIRLRSLMIFPISFVFTVECDFLAKIEIKNVFSKKYHNVL